MFAPWMLRGLADSGISKPPYSVREWCRFLTKLSRLLSKSDCFQPVSCDTPCNPPFRCRGVSIISFACVMTDSSTLKNSQTAAEGASIQHLCVEIVCYNVVWVCGLFIVLVLFLPVVCCLQYILIPYLFWLKLTIY